MTHQSAQEEYERNGVVTAIGMLGDNVLDVLFRVSRYIALLAAWIAMCGSLFFSEALGWLPCVLCWYQRILMYPLAIIIAVGLLRRDDRIHWYVLPFSTLGAGVSLYHYLLVKTDWLPPPPCVAGIPCTIEYLNWFGFINIPFLALTAFLIISFMAVISALDTAGDGDERDVGTASTPLDARGSHAFARTPVVVFGIIAGVVTSFIVAARFV